MYSPWIKSGPPSWPLSGPLRKRATVAIFLMNEAGPVQRPVSQQRRPAQRFDVHRPEVAGVQRVVTVVAHHPVFVRSEFVGAEPVAVAQVVVPAPSGLGRDGGLHKAFL